MRGEERRMRFTSHCWCKWQLPGPSRSCHRAKSLEIGDWPNHQTTKPESFWLGGVLTLEFLSLSLFFFLSLGLSPTIPTISPSSMVMGCDLGCVSELSTSVFFPTSARQKEFRFSDKRPLAIRSSYPQYILHNTYRADERLVS